MYTLNRLKNGLPVIAAPVDGTAAITVLMFAGAGSRYETREERGISHFLEHMFFKGGKKYPTAADVSRAIDSVGGDFNAFTGKEYAGYYVKVDATHTELACSVLSDMLNFASFPEQEIEKERGVIIEEYRMYQDTPMYQVGWDFEELMFGDQPLGWDTIGTEEVIRRVKQNDFVRHKTSLYTPDNLVLTFAGKIDEKKALALGKEFFIAQAQGDSMLPKIRSGDYLVFRANSQGTRQDKIVLAEYRGPADPETGGSYTVKKYRSAKVLETNGHWKHREVSLLPLNPEFEPIILSPADETEFRIVGECLGVLGRTF
jgi:hypothetical protein